MGTSLSGFYIRSTVVLADLSFYSLIENGRQACSLGFFTDYGTSLIQLERCPRGSVILTLRVFQGVHTRSFIRRMCLALTDGLQHTTSNNIAIQINGRDFLSLRRARFRATLNERVMVATVTLSRMTVFARPYRRTLTTRVHTILARGLHGIRGRSKHFKRNGTLYGVSRQYVRLHLFNDIKGRLILFLGNFLDSGRNFHRRFLETRDFLTNGMTTILTSEKGGVIHGPSLRHFNL